MKPRIPPPLPDEDDLDQLDRREDLWRPIAKDGADLPAAQAVPRPAQQIVAVGETYDFEFAPSAPGDMQLELFTGETFTTALVVVR